MNVQILFVRCAGHAESRKSPQSEQKNCQLVQFVSRVTQRLVICTIHMHVANVKLPFILASVLRITGVIYFIQPKITRHSCVHNINNFQRTPVIVKYLSKINFYFGMVLSDMVCTIKTNIFALMLGPYSEPTFNIVKPIFIVMLYVT